MLIVVFLVAMGGSSGMLETQNKKAILPIITKVS